MWSFLMFSFSPFLLCRVKSWHWTWTNSLLRLFPFKCCETSLFWCVIGRRCIIMSHNNACWDWTGFLQTPKKHLGKFSFFTFEIEAFSSWGTWRASRFRRSKTAVLTDSRIRIMNEVVSGIRIIKMYAWEKPLSALVTEVRR